MPSIKFRLKESEIQFQAIRAQGAGGQNVNKVSSALHLRFDINSSSLPDTLKERLLRSRDNRISSDGIIIIKAQAYRTQEKNKADGIQRLQQLIESVAVIPKSRRPTGPSRSAKRKRTDQKTQRGKLKNLRKKVRLE